MKLYAQTEVSMTSFDDFFLESPSSDINIHSDENCSDSWKFSQFLLLSVVSKGFNIISYFYPNTKESSQTTSFDDLDLN